MKNIIFKVVRLFIGLFLYAVGIVMNINANIGLAPWDVFHKGLSETFSITMGQASIGVGLAIVLGVFFLGERVGIGTLCNMYFIGFFMDILMVNNIIPVFEGFFPGLMLMLFGMLIIGVATVAYIGAGLGSGPRDGLMIALTKKTGRPVSFIRNIIEITALGTGFLLGGTLGIGTVIMSLTIGYFVQFAFKIFNFDVRNIQHVYIDDHIKNIKNKSAV